MVKFVLLFTSWYIIICYSSIKLTRSKLFCRYFLQKDNWAGGKASGEI